MDFEINETEDRIIIRVLCRNLDRTCCAAWQEHIGPAVSGRPIIADLSRVEFADAYGLEQIRTWARMAGEDHFGIVGLTYRLGQCLERLPEHRRPPAYDSIQQAFDVLRGKGQDSPVPGDLPADSAGNQNPAIAIPVSSSHGMTALPQP